MRRGRTETGFGMTPSIALAAYAMAQCERV